MRLPGLPAHRLWWLRWKFGWPVRFAHHPLCSRYGHETWRIGGAWICRGCLSLGGGLLIGLVAVLAAAGPWCGPLAVLLTAPVLHGSWPPRYRRLPRALRDLLRFLLGLWISIGTAALALASAWAWILLLPAIALWLRYRQERARVHLSRCEGCPELGTGVCSGYRPQAEAARRFEQAVEVALMERLDAGQTHPPWLAPSSDPTKSSRTPDPP